MRKIIITILVLGIAGPGWAQNIRLTLDSMQASPHDTLQYHIYVDTGFNRIQGVQFSVRWDPTVVAFLAVGSIGSNLQVKENLVSVGKLGLVWNAGTDTLTFAPRTVFLNLQFVVVGEAGSHSAIRLTDDPTPILFVGCCSEDKSDPIYPLKIFEPESNTGQIAINEYSEPSAEATLTHPRCFGDSTGRIAIRALGGSPPYQYHWSSESGYRAEAAIIEHLPAGTYSLLLTDRRGLETNYEYQLNWPAPLSFKFPDSIPICKGESVRLSPVPADFHAYSWSTGEQTASIQVSEPGTIHLTVFDSHLCTASDSLHIRQTPPVSADIIPATDFPCRGEPVAITASGGETYDWIDTTNSLIPLVEDYSRVQILPYTDTELGLIAANQCGEDTAFTVLAVSVPQGSAGPDTCIQRGTSAQLRATGGNTYRWLPAPSPISNPKISNPLVTPEESTYFTVEITDVGGCLITDSVLVIVADDPALSIPSVNVITPNNDGINDYLEFPNLEKYGPNSLQVFNRWGQVVFSSVNYQRDTDRWDGNYRGKPLPGGAYFYVLRLDNHEIKQTITLLRE